MPEVTIVCEAPGCTKSITPESGAVALGLMQLHQTNVHSHANTQKQKPPKVDRPRVTRGISGEEWATFERKWTMFKNATHIGCDEMTSQLLACCEGELENAIYNDSGDVAGMSEDNLLKVIKELSIIEVAETVRITELLGMKQGHGESVRAYVARLRGKAQICPFHQECTKCKDKVIYTDAIVRWVLLAGLASPDISREVLGTTDIDNKSLADTITLIKAKERAVRALNSDASQSASVSAVSTFRKAQGTGPAGGMSSQTVNCATCSKLTAKFGKNRKGQTVEYRMCTACFRTSRRRKTPASMSTPSTADSSAAVFDVIGGISLHAGETTEEACDNYIYTEKTGWHQTESKPQPMINLKASVDHLAYHRLNRSAPVASPAQTAWIADTGAMSCLGPIQILTELGLTVRDLLPVKRRMKTATEGEVEIAGAVFLKLMGQSVSGETHCARVMVYISPGAGALYLSRNAQEQLRIIPPSFPRVGAAAASAVHDDTHAPCGCLVRTPRPPRPDKLPFPATRENVPRMKAWLVEEFAASTFNKCPHQPLPTMTGPDMEIRLDPSVTRRPANVPIHWQDRVKQDLKRDEDLGVIEKVPPGTPVTWLHSMVLTPKADGSPRRTVDLKPLNKVSVRETHHTIPPAQQVRALPRNQVMTVFDAWNGYHAIPIRPEDRHKTTFMTEQGRYRYCRAPMGFLASGDTYTHRYDRIVADIPRLAKVVDDSLLYDHKDELEEHWWRCIDYLIRCGKNGIILNSEPDKFQFSEEEVKFTAFHVTNNGVKPLAKYLNAIQEFPRPANITDVRAWFGLVNQVARYGQLTELMAPFKPLLSPKITSRPSRAGGQRTGAKGHCRRITPKTRRRRLPQPY